MAMKDHELREQKLWEELSCPDEPCVFLESVPCARTQATSLLFKRFDEVLVFNHGDDLARFFAKVERLNRAGYWLAGYFSYEFGYYLEPALRGLRALCLPCQQPLAWLAAVRHPRVIEHRGPLLAPALNQEAFGISQVRANITRQEYGRNIQAIKRYLEAGLSYQVNFTFKVKFAFSGNPFALYLHLRRCQPTLYTAFINLHPSYILSHSPELFFEARQRTIVTRPMKGTVSRGLTCAEDSLASRRLKADTKTRAENVMIVDLLRNDLGRISKQVRVPFLFQTEQHPSLHQLTSTIAARLKSNTGLKDLLTALFPSGSVTGAPKIETMRIIRELEKEPRGIYTGAIGYITPRQQACFNVAIRTLRLEAGAGELGVGGGIVYDSRDEDEFKEALLKAKFFISGFPEFSLIETMRWSSAEGFAYLDLHCARLKSSCKYFSIPLRAAFIKKKLLAAVSDQEGPLKVRLLLSRDGSPTIETQPLEPLPLRAEVTLSPQPIEPANCFLYHKTTERKLYEEELACARAAGFFEVIFLNTRGEVTEGSFTTIFVQKEGRLYTPALRSGLLAGVLRRHLLDSGRAQEKSMSLKEILTAEALFVGNSLRGLIPAELILPQQSCLKAIEKTVAAGRI